MIFVGMGMSDKDKKTSGLNLRTLITRSFHFQESHSRQSSMDTHSSSEGSSEPETTAIRTDDINEVSSLGPVCLKVPKIILPRQYFNGEVSSRRRGETSKAFLRRTYTDYGKAIAEYFTTLNMRVKSTFSGPSVLYVVLNGKIHPGKIFSYDNCTVNEAMQFVSALDAIAFVDNIEYFVPKTQEIVKRKVEMSGGARRVKRHMPKSKKEITQFDLDTKDIDKCVNSIEEFAKTVPKLTRTYQDAEFVQQIIRSDTGDLLRVLTRMCLESLDTLVTYEKKKITTWGERDTAIIHFKSCTDTLKSLISNLFTAKSMLTFLPEDCVLFTEMEKATNEMAQLIEKISTTVDKLMNIPAITILSFNANAPKHDKRYESYLTRVIPSDEVPNMSDDIVDAIRSVIPSTLTKSEKISYCLEHKLPIIVE